MTQARAHLEVVSREGHDPALGPRRMAARARAAKDRVTRLEAALAQLPEVIATKKKSGAKDAEPRLDDRCPRSRHEDG